MATKDPKARGDVFVTGATGLLGRWLVPELSSRGHRVFALVRNADARRDGLAHEVARRGGNPTRVVWIDGDLDRPGLGLHAAAHALASVEQVFHLGARFAWGLSAAEAERTNVEGTRKVIELAASLPRAPRLVMVGGYRLAPRMDARGNVWSPEAHEFLRAGAYEASKYHAHVAALELAEARSVPWTVVHPSSVIGDSRTGETSQITGVGETIVALARGQLPARVGGPRTFVPLVPVDFVASFLARVGEREDARGVEFPLLDPSTPELDELIDRAASRLGVRAPRLRLPTWFVRALPESVTKTSREALGFLDDARYPAHETETMIAAMGIVRPSIETAFDRWVDYLAAEYVGAARVA